MKSLEFISPNITSNGCKVKKLMAECVDFIVVGDCVTTSLFTQNEEIINLGDT